MFWLEFAGLVVELGVLGLGARAALHGVTHIAPDSGHVDLVPGHGLHGH